MSDFKAKMQKIDFRWGSAADTAGGNYIAPPDSLVVFKRGLLLRGGRGKREGGKG